MMTQEQTLYRVTRVVWYVVGVIEAVLFLRFILKLFGANVGAEFTQVVYGISGVFLAPFQYVFGTPSVSGSVLEVSTILAMVVYWFIAWGVIKLIVMNRSVSAAEAETELTEQDRA